MRRVCKYRQHAAAIPFAALLSLSAIFYAALTVPAARAEPAAGHAPAGAAAAAASANPIAILHMYDGASFFRRLGALTGANKQRYAERHGYDFVERSPERATGLFRERACVGGETPPCWEDDPNFRIDAGRAPTFGKLLLAMAACNNRPNGWLLWSDADAMIVNQTQPLEAIIDDGYDVIVSYDWLMLQAGVLLFKCTPFTMDFIGKAYNDRQFDTARALDQSALEHFIVTMEKEKREKHIKIVPKYAMNVYLEEYRAGDFLVHMAGKLYEATEPGLWAIANQLDIFSIVDDVKDLHAFMSSRYLLNRFSGVCPVERGEKQSSCKPTDPRRFRLPEPLDAMSTPNRYRHVAMRYYFLQDWADKYDVPGWNDKRQDLSARPGAAPADPQAVVPPVFSGHKDSSSGPIATAPRLELAHDESPPHRDLFGGNGASLPKRKHSRVLSRTTSMTRLFAYIALILVLGGAVFFALWRREQQQSIKQR